MPNVDLSMSVCTVKISGPQKPANVSSDARLPKVAKALNNWLLPGQWPIAATPAKRRQLRFAERNAASQERNGYVECTGAFNDGSGPADDLVVGKI